MRETVASSWDPSAVGSQSKFSCPGKVILLGEYTVLHEGVGLAMPIKPLFELNVIRNQIGFTEDLIPFHEQSPAGQLIQRAQKWLKNRNLNDVLIQWNDPYPATLGVGSSTAQYLLIDRWLSSLGFFSSQTEPDFYRCMNTYYEFSEGSGIDLAVQYHNQFGRFNPKKLKFEPMVLPSQFNFYLVYTGSKQKTHEHLALLKSLGFPSANRFQSFLKLIDQLVDLGTKALMAGDLKNFGSAMIAYQEMAFKSLPGIQDSYIELYTLLRSIPGVLGVKGSGAQGGDCFLVLLENSYGTGNDGVKYIQRFFNKSNLIFSCSHQNEADKRA